MRPELRPLAKPPRLTRHNGPVSPYDARGRYRAYARYRYAQKRREKVLAETWFFTISIGLLTVVAFVAAQSFGG